LFILRTSFPARKDHVAHYEAEKKGASPVLAATISNPDNSAFSVPPYGQMHSIHQLRGGPLHPDVFNLPQIRIVGKVLARRIEDFKKRSQLPDKILLEAAALTTFFSFDSTRRYVSSPPRWRVPFSGPIVWLLLVDLSLFLLWSLDFPPNLSAHYD